jgi:hypothetical protein
MACIIHNPYAVCKPSDIAEFDCFDSESTRNLLYIIAAFTVMHVLILFVLMSRVNNLAQEINDLKHVILHLQAQDDMLDGHNKSNKPLELTAIAEDRLPPRQETFRLQNDEEY